MGRKPKPLSPRAYATRLDRAGYTPQPGRTLYSERTWYERVMDLRHAVGLTVGEFSDLTGFERKSFSPTALKTPVMATMRVILKLEAVFIEELVRYLDKPHNLLNAREAWFFVRRQPYGGYKRHARIPRKLQRTATVVFEGRTFKDIAQMADVQAIRRIKSTQRGQDIIEHRRWPDDGSRGKSGASGYGRVIEAASRGIFMPLAEIACELAGDHESPAG